MSSSESSSFPLAERLLAFVSHRTLWSYCRAATWRLLTTLATPAVCRAMSAARCLAARLSTTPLRDTTPRLVSTSIAVNVCMPRSLYSSGSLGVRTPYLTPPHWKRPPRSRRDTSESRRRAFFIGFAGSSRPTPRITQVRVRRLRRQSRCSRMSGRLFRPETTARAAIALAGNASLDGAAVAKKWAGRHFEDAPDPAEREVSSKK